jgi:hypothetical protein
MYKLYTASVILFAAMLCCSGKSVGQARKDSGANSQAIASTISFFNNAIGKQSRVYNGIGNDPYPRTIEGSAYFMDTATMVKGSIVYEGNRYDNVPLQYDLFGDLLISYFSDGFSRYSFLKEKVNTFDLLGHHFVHLLPDGAGGKILADAFYDDLYDHRLQVIARREKTLQSGPLTNNNDKNYQEHFESAVSYYLRKDGVYHKVGSEGSFMDVLKDHKKELKRHLKESNIKFRKEPEKVMQLLAGYYEQLTN